MSYLKIGADQFVGSVEYNKLKQFIDEDGFRKILLQNSLGFGVVDISKDGNFSNFLVSQGTNSGTIKHELGLAIDSDGLLIRKLATDNIAVINDSQWYWIKVSHQYSPIEEEYEVSIDRSGNLTADGNGNFTEILRGQSNNASKIRFSGTSLNTGEYAVVEVIDNNSAVLAGDFQIESNIKVVVIGTFTPDISVPAGSKEIFQYDSCVFTQVLETTLNTPPALTEDKEFLIARIRRVGSTITIQDKRSLNVFKTKSDYDLSTVPLSDNPLIGVEAIKFNHNNTPRDKNLVYMAWGMRSSNWTFDSSVNRVTIIGGLGGVFKDTSDFSDGDFDGFRLYFKSGKYATIKQSSITATQINLILDSLDVDELNVDLTQELHIVPNAEQIEIIAETGDNSELPEQRFLFDINVGYVKLPLVAYADPNCTYVMKYRYKNFGTYSEEALIPDDAVGYLVEADFDIDGDQTASARQVYSNGIITLNLASNAYINRINSLDSGDSFGVEVIAIDTSVDPIIELEVGVRKKHIIFSSDDDLDASDSDFGDEVELTDDVYISLVSSEDLINGNNFTLQFRGDYNFNGFGIRIVQDYVNGSNTGIDIYGLTELDLIEARRDGLSFTCIWDGERWFIKRQTSLAPIIQISNILNSYLINGWTAVGGSVIIRRYGKVHTLSGSLSPGSASDPQFLSGLPSGYVVPSDGLVIGKAKSVVGALSGAIADVYISSGNSYMVASGGEAVPTGVGTDYYSFTISWISN